MPRRALSVGLILIVAAGDRAEAPQAEAVCVTYDHAYAAGRSHGRVPAHVRER
jgi:hypothetical protein